MLTSSGNGQPPSKNTIETKKELREGVAVRRFIFSVKCKMNKINTVHRNGYISPTPRLV
tara:strand:- start:609 stop:785 length:177 start_codon:yes stop_codon:yes gene_type:complete